MKPIRIQRSRQHKQVSPNGLPIIYCGRGSKYGNPFKLGDKLDTHWLNIIDNKDIDKYLGKVLERKDCLHLFDKYVKFKMAEFKDSNKGSNLSCWCKISDSCHADILLKLWNS